MRVYLDVVFVLNGVVNYCLLGASARLLGSVSRRLRLLGASLLGACYACATFLPGLTFLAAIPWRIAVLVGMLLLAYGCKKRTIYLGAIFLGLSLCLSGLVMVLGSVLGAQVWLLEGRVFYALGFSTLVLTAGVLYLGAWLLLQGSMAHSNGGICTAQLVLLGKRAELSMLRDTGNTLRDPFTGHAIPVVEWRTFARLLPEASDGFRLCAQDSVQAMAKLHDTLPELSMRLIPYCAVGTERALLLAVRCDALCVGGKTRRGIYVAVSPTNVSENGAYDGLIGEGE